MAHRQCLRAGVRHQCVHRGVRTSWLDVVARRVLECGQDEPDQDPSDIGTVFLSFLTHASRRARVCPPRKRRTQCRLAHRAHIVSSVHRESVNRQRRADAGSQRRRTVNRAYTVRAGVPLTRGILSSTEPSATDGVSAKTDSASANEQRQRQRTAPTDKRQRQTDSDSDQRTASAPNG